MGGGTWRGSMVPRDAVDGGFVARICTVVVSSCGDDGWWWVLSYP